MKIKIAVVIQILIIGQSLYGQVDVIGNTVGKGVPQLVTNPILETSAISMSSAQSAMNTSIAAMELEQKAINEVMKKASWARDLETVRRLTFLLERVICTSKDLNVRLSYFDNSCLFDFGFEMNIVKIHLAADFLSLLITDGIIMSTGERMEAINNSVQKFQEAQTALGNLNATLDRELRKKELAAKSQKANIFFRDLR